MLVPLVIGISYAFRDIQLLNPFSGGFVGLAAFPRRWPTTRISANALVNTLLWTVASVVLQFIFGLILALLLNRPFRGRGIVQALVFLPWAVPSFLSGLNWAWLFNPVVGPMPHWLVRARPDVDAPNNILSDPQHAIWGPIIANVWWGIPFFAITLLAALQSIPRDLYEAAAIDGAGAVPALPLDHPALPGADHRHHRPAAHRLDRQLRRPHRGDDQAAARPTAPRSSRATSSPRPSSGSISAMPRRSRSCCCVLLLA